MTSIFLKLDYIYLIKLIKQIKYIIPLQKHKINYKIIFFNFKYMYHKRTTITFLSKLKNKKQTLKYMTNMYTHAHYIERKFLKC